MKGLKKSTLTIRLEGNICEDCPSDMHRYDISGPVEPGAYNIDFTSYAPKHRYELIIKTLTKAASILPLTEMITPCTKGSTFFLT